MQFFIAQKKFVWIDYTNLNNYALWIEIDRMLDKMGILLETFDTDFMDTLTQANIDMQVNHNSYFRSV